MAVSIDNYLRTLSYKFYLKKDETEKNKINRSVDTLLNNLDKEMGCFIHERFIFGSYERDTILPRSIDSKSDVDIMVVFNHSEYDRSPTTYRKWLKDFADKYYKNRYGSTVKRSFPTVVIELNNIHYDLVPAKEDVGFVYGKALFIPDKNDGWQVTDPSDVSESITRANKKYNNIVKPIVRLLKAWNCTKDYPYDSYKLELEISRMNFSGDNIESGFFYAARNLPTSWSDTQTKTNKLKSLKYNLDNAKYYLELNDSDKAKQWLHRVLPY